MRRLAVMAWLVAAVLLVPCAGAAQTRCWPIRTDESQLVVHVRRAGLFSPALHDHHFVPETWHGEMCFDPAALGQLRVELTIAADSLQDRQPELSAEDRAKVEQQVKSPEVLDAAQYPTIRFRSNRFDASEASQGRASGDVVGELSLHGRTEPIRVPVEARWGPDWLRATGRVSFKQRSFGIEPYSRFLGTVGVEDEVTVEFALDLVPPSSP